MTTKTPIPRPFNWHDHFEYEPVSGVLVWKARIHGLVKTERMRKSWNTRIAGKVAGNKTSRGVRVSVYDIGYYAHRIIWEMHHGPIPEGMVIDHINCNPLDNRLSNLRLCTHAENCRNSKTDRKNTSGFKGVSLHSDGTNYVAQIALMGRVYYLGRFQDPHQAHLAYCAAAKRLHGEYAKTE